MRKNSVFKKIINIIISIVFILFLFFFIRNTARSYRYRNLCDKYTEQLSAATEANRALNDRLGRITEVVGRLSETTERNVTDARDIIETVELLRTQIQELENICYGSDSIDSYYSYWDNIYGLEQ